MSRLALISLVVLVSACSPAPQHRPIEPGREVEQAIEAGTTHRYAVDLEAGDLLEFVVEQLGVDLALRLSGPDGKTILEVDSPTDDWGPESLIAVAVVEGLHLAEVIASEHGSPGRYLLRVTTRRATEQDRRRAAAVATFAAAETLRRAASFEAAARAYRTAETAFRSLDDPLRAAHANHRMALVLQRTGDTAAGEVATRAAQAFAALEEPRLEAMALDVLGRIRRSEDDLPAALEAFRTALDHRRRAGDRLGEGITLNNLGAVYRLRGDFDSARASYDRALTIWSAIGDDAERATTLHNLGTLHRALGEDALALDRFAVAASLRAGRGESKWHGAALDQIGRILAARGDTRGALEHFRHALQLLATPSTNRLEAIARVQLARLQHRAGAETAAAGHFERARATFEHLDLDRDEALTRLDLARLDLRAGRPHVAFTTAEQVTETLRAMGDEDAALAARIVTVRALHATDRLAEAHTMAEALLDSVEILRLRTPVPIQRATWLATVQDAYDAAIRVAMARHDQDPDRGWNARALTIHERERARSLLDHLGESVTALDRVWTDEERAQAAGLHAETTRLARRRFALQSAPRPDAVRIAALDRALRSAQDALNRLAARARQRDPHLLTSRAEILDVEGIRRRVLDPDSALVVFHLGTDQGVAWVLDPLDLSSASLPDASSIETLAHRARRAVVHSGRREGAGAWTTIACALADAVLGPVADRLQNRTLLVVADGVLSGVPWSALPDPRDTATCAERAVLGERHAIVSLPSASALAAIRALRSARGLEANPPRGVAVWADPVFRADDARLGGVQEQEGPGASHARFDVLLPRLHHSAREALAAASLTPEATVLTGFAATAEALRDGRFATRRLLHLATHAVVDDVHPAASGLAFSRVDAGGRPIEGLVRLDEIAALDLAAELVVVSACRTAEGRVLAGEGPLSLGRAFFHAGVASVLVSLWPVDDRATAELMTHFYRALATSPAAGLQAADALRKAQAEMRAAGTWSPRDWAGFVVQGDAR